MPTLKNTNFKVCLRCNQRKPITSFSRKRPSEKRRNSTPKYYPWCESCLDKLNQLEGDDFDEAKKEYTRDYYREYNKNYKSPSKFRALTVKKIRTFPTLAKIFLSKVMDSHEYYKFTAKTKACQICATPHTEPYHYFPPELYPEFLFLPTNLTYYCERCKPKDWTHVASKLDLTDLSVSLRTLKKVIDSDELREEIGGVTE